MAFNLSGVDISKYYDINTAVSISLFSILVLPPLLLCVLCVLALVFAKEINSKIRLLLINIFAVEICKWISYTLFYLGLPIRLLYQDSVTCKLFVSFSFIAAQIFVAVAFYAIHVYIFIKYGEKKLKWTVVIPLLIVSWTVHIAAAIVPSFDEFGSMNNNGFCTSNPDSILYKGFISAIAGLELLFLSIQLICSILTIVYIRRNTLEGNTNVKKAVAKVLAYFAIASILSFINNILPAINPLVYNAIADDDIATIVAVYYLLRLVFNIPSIATPIVTIVMLKSVRDALKTTIKKICQTRKSQVLCRH